VGVGGAIPEINQILTAKIPNNYEAAALNVEVPIFNGHLFTARREAARFRAQAEDQRVRDLQERIARDVRVAWSSSKTAFQNIDVTAELLREASLALDLAQGRYNLGLSSMVELYQAELNITQAEIENLNAKYDYQSIYAMLQYTMGLLR
jgi:outer membrane protein